MRDFSKTLYILLSGHGETLPENFIANLEDYIFGSLDTRDFQIWWLHETPSAAVSTETTIRTWASQFGTPEVDPPALVYYPVSPDEYLSTHSQLTDKLFFLSGDVEKAYVSLFAPDNPADLEAITHVKDLPEVEKEFPTLNLCEGLVDSFPGYMTPQEREAQKALEAAQKPRRASRKKAVATAPMETVAEPQKPAESLEAAPGTSTPSLPGIVEDRILNLRDLRKFIEENCDSCRPVDYAARNIVSLGEALLELIDNFSAMLTNNY